MPVGRSVRVAVVTVAAAAAPVLAGLRSAPNECGDHSCQPHQYCSRTINLCADCSGICEPGTKNYQQETCQSDCQDYLHDMLYQNKHGDVNVAAAMSRLEGDLHRLTIMVSVMFCLFIVCFIGLAAYACSSYRKACRTRKTADLESNSIELKKIGAKTANGLTPVPPLPPAGPPALVPKPSAAPLCAVGGRPSLSFIAKPTDEEKRVRSRHPSEDTCPGDYSVVYDNPGLVATPPLAAAAAVPGSSTSLYSRDSLRTAGSGRGTERTATAGSRVLREVDITDLSPDRALHAM